MNWPAWLIFSVRQKMIGSRAAFLVVGLVSAMRSIVLLRKKEYRVFPLLMLLFLFGAGLATYGASKYISGDMSLRPAARGSGVAWYQDLLGGVGVALMAVGASIGYSNLKKPNQSPSQRGQPSVDDRSSRT